MNNEDLADVHIICQVKGAKYLTKTHKKHTGRTLKYMFFFNYPIKSVWLCFFHSG